MKLRYFACLGIITALFVCFLVERNVLRGDTFSTGASTNTIPGSLIVTSAAQFNTTLSITNDVVLTRDAANVLALRNGTNKTAFYSYGSYTDAANYQSVGFDTDFASSALLSVVAKGAGTGANPNLYIGTAGSGSVNFFTSSGTRWTLLGAGSIAPNSDNTYDIGTSAKEVKNLYIGTSIFFGTNVLAFNGTNLTWNGTAITVP